MRTVFQSVWQQDHTSWAICVSQKYLEPNSSVIHWCTWIHRSQHEWRSNFGESNSVTDICTLFQWSTSSSQSRSLRLVWIFSRISNLFWVGWYQWISWRNQAHHAQQVTQPSSVVIAHISRNRSKNEKWNRTISQMNILINGKLDLLRSACGLCLSEVRLHSGTPLRPTFSSGMTFSLNLGNWIY